MQQRLHFHEFTNNTCEVFENKCHTSEPTRRRPHRINAVSRRPLPPAEMTSELLGPVAAESAPYHRAVIARGVWALCARGCPHGWELALEGPWVSACRRSQTDGQYYAPPRICWQRHQRFPSSKASGLPPMSSRAILQSGQKRGICSSFRRGIWIGPSGTRRENERSPTGQFSQRVERSGRSCSLFLAFELTILIGGDDNRGATAEPSTADQIETGQGISTLSLRAGR
jgi:hypothetical protein